MRTTENRRRAWLITGFGLALAFFLGSGVAEAKKDEAGGKCEGTKKQRKQKMEKREITDAQLQAMMADYLKKISDQRELMKERAARRLEREYEAHKTTGEPFVFDILAISGGGAKGAFGAGFLEGWGTIEEEAYARPEFDMVTGVSTGALIAPYAFIGSDEAYATAADFYANPQPNWVTKRGTIKYLPSHVSMFNNCHLQDTIRQAIGPDIVESLAGEADEDRLLLIGTTNLDAGAGHIFDLGREAEESLEGKDFERIASILLASSSIPGVFPPIEIDGMLHADGGATSNLFIAAFPGPDGPVGRFLSRHPGAPLPKVRVWIIVNQHLKPQPAVTQPRWIGISGRALGTLTSSSQLFALGLIRDMVREARAERGVDAEMYLMSIPEDAPKKTSKGMFDQDHMRLLQDLGRELGADPTSWTREIPSAYEVEKDWLESK